MSPDALDAAREVADAVLYEGYLLYPYRASARKNQVRWQFGVLGPPEAAEAGWGEQTDMAAECLLRVGGGTATLAVRLRFLQLQARTAERADPDHGFTPVGQLRCGEETWTSWDEAVERETATGPLTLGELTAPVERTVQSPGGEETEHLEDEATATVGRLRRRRWPLTARLRIEASAPADDLLRLRVQVDNTGVPAADKDDAIRRSLIGAHLLLVVEGAQFVSLLDPPDDLREEAAGCSQHRLYPVLIGEPGQADQVLASPIILYDYPEIAPQSPGALFDSTEIDEILTLRTMTLTDEEKAAARATDPLAAEIIDRCDQLSPEQLQAMHGLLRDPHALDDPPADPGPNDVPWWSPEADASVDPETDGVLVNGVLVAKGSSVRLRPTRRADAQDLFYAGRVATVTAVVRDVDDETHVAVTVDDDPAAELHDWYGRYLYFAPDEIEPVGAQPAHQHRQEEPS